ncbi:hypothetical protein ACEQ8H_008518 [Pleosporales sp. CAS-2024a]
MALFGVYADPPKAPGGTVNWNEEEKEVSRSATTTTDEPSTATQITSSEHGGHHEHEAEGAFQQANELYKEACRRILPASTSISTMTTTTTEIIFLQPTTTAQTITSTATLRGTVKMEYGLHPAAHRIILSRRSCAQ